ncbi:MAG: 2-C-methyl-D-erythritol 2,4-cyclodiphosphate synthase [SAR324 cluster bacterium]|nr:2-C-methyl-D-erythritol 2,4-cyclodiphosphate synthase [SAR324 cluster bacterium]
MIDYKVGLGQDSHRFLQGGDKPLILGGIVINNHLGFVANSDGDIILHSLTNAISSVTGKRILGKIADSLCANGQTDSLIYIKLALADLEGWKIRHAAISIEALTPKLEPHIEVITKSVAKILKIDLANVNITATSGEGLTKFGEGLGMQSLAVVTFIKEYD